MIYKSFSETELFQGETNKTYEYNIEDKDINYCIVDVDGRFPKEKWAVNHKCKQMAHVLDGDGVLVVHGVGAVKLKKDDVVLIDVEEKYYWEGKMRLGIPCTPAWYPEQHEDVD